MIRSGIYSGYLYAHKAVQTIVNISQFKEEKLFLYLAWHNTHTPLECPAGDAAATAATAAAAAPAAIAATALLPPLCCR